MPGLIMSAIAETAGHVVDDRLAKRNALVLAVAQALAGGNNAVIVSTSGIVGVVLAPDRTLATLSATMLVVGTWLGTLPMGMLAARFGRRFALQVGTIAGILSGLISCIAVIYGSFALFCIGAFCGGFYAAGHQSYRFAAADTATEAFRPKAISWVLTGGVIAAFIGANLVIATKDLWQPYLFAATYLAQSALALLAGVVLAFTKFPRPPARARASAAVGRPLMDIARTPRFIIAVICGVAAYALMNLMMTSAPLAMVDCGHSVNNAMLGTQWHMLGMFAPSFFTGGLIVRFGVERVVLVGLALTFLSAVVGLTGTGVWHFWTAVTLIGVGWNFAFIGATTIVTQCHRPHERYRVQSFNDFLIFGSMTISSFASGALLAQFGWTFVNGVVLPPVLVAATLLIWLTMRERRTQPT
jgi:MFS family permease